MTGAGPFPESDTGAIDAYLEERLGRFHARQRLGVERDHEAQVFGQGRTFFHPENFRPSAAIIAGVLKLSGLYWRGEANARRVMLRRNDVRAAALPPAFRGFTLLHLSDLHVDISAPAMARAAELIAGAQYDICVLTGDFRGRTFGPMTAAMEGMARLMAGVTKPAYAVLGNHDSIRMVPGLERMGLHVLLNEAVRIERGGDAIHLAGVDDAHFFRADNLEKAAAGIPPGAFSILLSHTPEIYRQAAHADFDLMLSGHTHGGQICLPGGVPVTLDSVLPRRFGAGAWRHHGMQGYTSRGAGTSIVPVRFNCAPEITLHRLDTA